MRQPRAGAVRRGDPILHEAGRGPPAPRRPDRHPGTPCPSPAVPSPTLGLAAPMLPSTGRPASSQPQRTTSRLPDRWHLRLGLSWRFGSPRTWGRYGTFCFLDLGHRICYGARGQDGFSDVTREEERRRAPHRGEVVPIGSPCEQRRTCWGSERLHFAPDPQPLLRGQGVHRSCRAPPAGRPLVAEDRERRRHPQPNGTGGLSHAIPR